MALTADERKYPNMIPADRIMTWEEFVEWLRLMADVTEAEAMKEEAEDLSEDERCYTPGEFYDWISNLGWW